MDVRELFRNAQHRARSSYDAGVDGLMDRLGVEQQRSTMEIVLPALGIFGAGIAVGAALGLLFAPKRGDELRGDLRHRIGDLRDRSLAEYEALRERSERMIERGEDESIPQQERIRQEAGEVS